MLLLDIYCSLVLNIMLSVIMLLAISVSPSSSPEWLMLDSISLMSLDFIYCHKESLFIYAYFCVICFNYGMWRPGLFRA